MDKLVYYSYRVHSTTFRSGSFINLIPIDRIVGGTTPEVRETFRKDYKTSIEVVNGLGRNQLLYNFAVDNPDLIFTADLRQGIPELPDGAIFKTTEFGKHTFYIIEFDGESLVPITLGSVVNTETEDIQDYTTIKDNVTNESIKILMSNYDGLFKSKKIKIKTINTLNDVITVDNDNLVTLGSYNGKGLITLNLTAIKGMSSRYNMSETELFDFVLMEELLHVIITETLPKGELGEQINDILEGLFSRIKLSTSLPIELQTIFDMSLHTPQDVLAIAVRGAFNDPLFIDAYKHMKTLVEDNMLNEYIAYILNVVSDYHIPDVESFADLSDSTFMQEVKKFDPIRDSSYSVVSLFQHGVCKRT